MFGIRCGDGICRAKVSHNKNTPAKCSAAGPTTGRGTGIIPRVLFVGSEAVGRTVQLKFPQCALFARVHGRPYILFATRMFERHVFKTRSRRRCRFRPANKRDPKFGPLSSTTRVGLLFNGRKSPPPSSGHSVTLRCAFWNSFFRPTDGVRQRMTYVGCTRKQICRARSTWPRISKATRAPSFRTRPGISSRSIIPSLRPSRHTSHRRRLFVHVFFSSTR